MTALVVIGAIVGGVRWWIEASKWVGTDDAFIDTHTVQVSAKVAGRVKAVLVDDNQEVHADQPLIELDPADFQTALSQALANQESPILVDGENGIVAGHARLQAARVK